MGRVTLLLVTAMLLFSASSASARCRWHLRVTGGRTPGSPIVLQLTDSCDHGGPEITKRIGFINVFPRHRAGWALVLDAPVIERLS